MATYIYSFSEGTADQRDLLGGKGANLAEMVRLGIPVPPGFTITTQTCNLFLHNQNRFPEGLDHELTEQITHLEKTLGKTFGGADDPLLVSVRSGAPVSMPGMMDTVLNLGLNDITVEGLASKTGNPRFAYDSYRRFIQMFANVVLGVAGHEFETIIRDYKTTHGKVEDTEMTAEDWQAVIISYKKVVQEKTGKDFPQDPADQLEAAIRAVFTSWLIPRAVKYRQIYNISDDLGTAVNVQAMVFGNKGETSGTGVLFSRDPSTGAKNLYGEFLLNAQGEDVVAGVRTPEPIAHLSQSHPDWYAEIEAVAQKLETHFGDMQDIEFTVEEGRLFILQTRSGKRSAAAGLQMAVDMVAEGLIDEKKALMRLDLRTLEQVLHPTLKKCPNKEVLTKGLPASPGAAVGKIVFCPDQAENWDKDGESVILVRYETCPEDIHGMHVAAGILTACGGMTSHAAVVARGMGTPCVSGATEIFIDEEAKTLRIGTETFTEGDFLTIDGNTGEVIGGKCETEPVQLSGAFATVLQWSEEFGQMRVRTNADTPEDAQRAREFGAQGIGLCRTEHMFFAPERILAVRRMILAESESERDEALAQLLPFQREDFVGIFRAMAGYPVNIRLLDPPLHEFLPHTDSDIETLAKQLNRSFHDLKTHIHNLHEVNPMLGHRGCRLMVTYPEVARMQARAIVEAACQVQSEGVEVFPEIMIPLVGLVSELKFLRTEIEMVATEVFASQNTKVPLQIGTMIEIPRACLIADEIAAEADYFSFGTNDLTQLTFGYSRDDVGKFLPHYQEHKFLPHDPFEVLDTEGVGKLISQGVEKGRSAKSDLKIGICGEHGGEPRSIDFCFHHDFNYVSCSPYRVPVARVAVAQSWLRKWEN